MGFKDRAKTRAKQLAAGDKFKLQQEDNFIRILPTPESKEGAEDEVFMEILMHSGVGPDSKNQKYLRCGHDVYDKTRGSCWLCDVYIPRLIEKGHIDTADDMKAKWTLCLQVLRLDEDSNKYMGPFFYMVAGKLGKTILTTISSGKRDITHPTKGYTMTINRQGEGLKTTYTGPILDEDPTEIPERFVDMLKPFKQLQEVPQYSESVQKAAVKGEKPSGGSERRRGVLDDEDTAEETPRRRRPAAEDDEDAPKSRRRAEPEDDEDEKPRSRRPARDEDEDERPARRPARDDEDEDRPKRRPAARDDEDEDRPKRRARDEDDEDERPKRRSRDEDEDDRPARREAPPKRSRDEDEDEDRPRPKRRAAEPEDEPDDDEDVAEEPPKRSAGKKVTVSRTRAVEPEDEDEAADEPEERPKRRARDEDEPAPRKPAPKRSRDEDEPPARGKTSGKSSKRSTEPDDEDPFGDE